MSHRQVLESLSGLLLGMFVSILAGTVVSTSLPRIISDLKGDQNAYTWVVTATLLATTVSTPLWGKFADLFNRKLLIQLALGLFVIGSALAGFSQDTNMLIVFRVFQGLGAGGLAALSQIIMADIISPRERGKYAGLFGGVMAIGTVGGPLLGGVVTDAFGWRWNFFIAMPVAIVAIVLLQMTLRLPAHPKRKVRIDYLGAVLIAGGVSLLLIWVSLAGKNFDWASWETAVMVGGAVVLLIAAVITELTVAEPIIPMGMFKNRTFSLAVVASISVGVSMFGVAVFLAQYMQLARGATPTQSGLLTIPMMAGLLIASTIFGGIISRTGKWKAIMISGGVLAVIGTSLLSTLRYDTDLVLVGIYMAVLGAGLGMLMQNLVLVVQNSIEVKNLGVATSAVTFFRSLGGTVGVSVLGSMLGTVIADRIKTGIAGLAPADQALAAQALGSGTIPQPATLPDAVRVVVESAYGIGVGDVFLYSIPLAVVTLIAVVLLPNVSLGSKNAVQLKAEPTTPLQAAEDALIAASDGQAALRPVGQARRTDDATHAREGREATPAGHGRHADEERQEEPVGHARHAAPTGSVDVIERS
ncbi:MULTISPECIES: MDR family MFS transporter [unclassified Rathayibacter]|uniref:MDR family MFS transporter n=1 Tax=unclassified Rathayibacter TaxID=2609250 RepID=UPI000CE88E30|nr:MULTISPECIES: MDR family MFS transporter [unclassified Rathayibacter]PPG10915.1 MFS transporter [Rathayibacter sp. AY2B1]PPG70112.1 MFS transporter [Rathayibacter sp. AY1F4]PPH17634.1 MFS transporter [Rathayibacter sp. AY1F8]PPH29202.1 MFS transporter [Rathayibacter sp. AY1F9]PPH37497.1 MFS transporter [Rathayibacter sp. AY1E3]